MTHRRPALLTALAPALLSVALLAGCGSTTTASDAPGAAASGSPTPTDGPTQEKPAKPGKDKPSEEPAVVPGAYVDWDTYDADRAAYAATDVVLFFHAGWCPSCRATEESLDTDGVPDGLTIVKVDFDTANDLRQLYGVTVQHTYVQVQPDGTQVKKWTGTLSGKDIAAEIA